MPKCSTDRFDKLLVKSMDFSIFLANFTEDLKIEESSKNPQPFKSDILYCLINYDPVKSAGLSKLRRDLTDKWF